jgi:hypothetical protein
MTALEAAGRIVLTQVTPAEIEESQTKRVVYGDFSYALADYLRQQGCYVPELSGPNRAQAKLWPSAKVAAFHRANQTKLRLQRAGRYRQLWWRKLTVELPRFLARYVRWFAVRILRVKSLFGLRKELPPEQLARFR